jgi:hypothetical protein
MAFKLALCIAVICSQLAVSGGSAWAQRRCPAGDSGCTLDNATDRIRDRVNQGNREVQDANTAREKVDAVKRTLKDCVNCGMDAVKGAVTK